jgi:CDP-paratose 2-epimerase
MKPRKPLTALPMTRKPILITGGSGFVGTNVAHRLVQDGHRVIVYDNLSRAGVAKNLEWLTSMYGDAVDVEVGDVRDAEHLQRVVRRVSHVFHFAAQVAVTTSLTNPIEDFDINARGTLNVLEAVRSVATPPSLLFTSTNKVYGDLQQMALVDSGRRYQPASGNLAGVSEQTPLSFHSPYGCSKGAADQYVVDYARSYRIPAAVFRMSCIYGPHQFGNEDQGWVAHFLIRALEGRTINLYGDGRQVRDILFVDDLVEAFLAAWSSIETISGEAFNIGGGPENTVSLLELLETISSLRGSRVNVDFADWRVGDQRYYVSDTRKFAAATGWAPQVSVRTGVEALYRWLQQMTDVEDREAKLSAPAAPRAHRAEEARLS